MRLQTKFQLQIHICPSCCNFSCILGLTKQRMAKSRPLSPWMKWDLFQSQRPILFDDACKKSVLSPFHYITSASMTEFSECFVKTSFPKFVKNVQSLFCGGGFRFSHFYIKKRKKKKTFQITKSSRLGSSNFCPWTTPPPTLCPTISSSTFCSYIDFLFDCHWYHWLNSDSSLYFTLIISIKYCLSSLK